MLNKLKMQSVIAIQVSIVLAIMLVMFLFGMCDVVNPVYSQNNTLYVDVGAGQNITTCGTITTPCHSISYTLNNRANIGDTVLVAQGIYTENLTINIRVLLLGGHEPMGWTRNITLYETVVDGNRLGSAILFQAGSDDAVLDGFTIRGGEANVGGGISIWDVNPTISNNTIIGNVSWIAGGGIYTLNSSSIITGNTIIENRSEHGGGGIEVHSSPVRIANNNIYENAADTGGGVRVWNSESLIIENNDIRSNSAGDGGGVLIVNNSSPTIKNNMIMSNTAFVGGGIHTIWYSSPLIEKNTLIGNHADTYGGGIQIAVESSPTVKENTVNENSSYQGGAIGIWDQSAPTIISNTISNNIAWQGSGVYVWEKSAPIITGNEFTGNLASGTGGGVWASYTSSLLDQSGNPLPFPDTYNLYSENTPNDNYLEPAPPPVPDPVPGNDLLVPSEYPTIQNAINSAVDGDTVIVSSGIYTETINFNGKNITVRSDNPNDLNSVQTTIIDGGAAGSVVIFQNQETTASVLTGFTIRNGAVSGDGGGIFISDRSNPVIINNIIVNNLATRGGGIGCWNSSPEIISNTITQNVGEGDGAGIFAVHACHATIQGNQITENTTANGFGAGIFIEYSSPVITNNSIVGNMGSGGMGAGIRLGSSSASIISNTISQNISLGANSGHSQGAGGGIASDLYGSPKIERNIIRNNQVGNHGGGLYLEFGLPEVRDNIIDGNIARTGGGIFSTLYSSGIIEHNIIQYNQADDGGGLTIIGYATPLIRDNQISNNIVSLYGGAINILIESTLIIDGNNILNNQAGLIGGAIYCGQSHARVINNVISGNVASTAGGLHSVDSTLELVNDIIAGNSSTSVGGLNILDSTIKIINSTIAQNNSSQGSSGLYCENCMLTITNSILWDNNNRDIELSGENGVVITYSDIEQGFVGTGNIISDPLFVDTTDDDFHILFGSPCIDSGIDVTLSTDFEGDHRPFDGNGNGMKAYDMGADEWIGNIRKIFIPLVLVRSE